MSTLDDFLGPLNQGVWEVTIPKEQVSEPLDPGWERSAINVPTPGTVASYRKGRYHVHETRSEWKVHLDNHDPKKRPLMHLIDDAPLLLMIGDTFITLIAGTRKKRGETEEILEDQTRAWHQLSILGVVVMFFGILIINSPIGFFSNTFTLFLPLGIVALGCLAIYEGFSRKKKNGTDWESVLRGLVTIGAGILAMYIPIIFWARLVLIVLAVWMFASAFILLTRARKGRAAIPEGFFSRLAIALVSLALAVLIIVEPIGILALLMMIIGVVAFLLGLMLFMNGLQLRQRMASR